MLLLQMLLALSLSANANERVFTYTYDTLTLPSGVRELEPRTTVALPRGADSGLIIQQRLEVEWGVSDRLMTTFAMNWKAEAGGSAFQGVSSEWKLGLLPRATHAVGLALYGEASVGPTETELEAKVLIDKEIGRLLVAYNLIGGLEVERSLAVAGVVDWERAMFADNRLGISFKPGAGSVGVELLGDTEFGEGRIDTQFAVGPATSWAADGWWVAASAPVTLVEWADGDTARDRAVQVRLLLGFDF